MNKKSWNSIISKFPSSSILQTWEWGEMKKITGWQPDHYIHRRDDGEIDSAALILSREQKILGLRLPVKILYVPHGPLLDWSNAELTHKVLGELIAYARQQRAAYIKIDPQVVPNDHIPSGIKFVGIIPNAILGSIEDNGWKNSIQQIQFRNTFWIDLAPEKEKLLSAMKQKTRYNIRLAERKGIVIREGGVKDLDLLYTMYLETSLRDGFIIRPRTYYLNIWEKFINASMAIPLIAMADNEPVAALILFYFGRKSYYLYGMSRDIHREKMPNYLLQWEAIKTSKQLGCEIYDLWGAPDILDESDRMWGVYRFKEGLGAKVIQTIGAYDFATSCFTYTIIQILLPVGQYVTRFFRRKQIREELEQA